MLFPCEFIVKKVLPAIRAGIVKELSEEYHLKQNQIANKLGITQPAVSLYLSGDRGRFQEIYEAIDKSIMRKLADEVMKNVGSTDPIEVEICNICVELRQKGELIELLCKADPDSEGQICKMTWMHPILGNHKED